MHECYSSEHHTEAIIPDPHPFELSEKERMEKYQHLADGLQKNKDLLSGNFSKKYIALTKFFEWLDLIIPNNKYTDIKINILESAKCFADCIVSFDISKAGNEEWLTSWTNDQVFWHKQFEENLKNLSTILTDIGQHPNEETMSEIKFFIDEKYKEDGEEQASFHIFCHEFASFVACKQAVWKDLDSGDNEREKVLIEK